MFQFLTNILSIIKTNILPIAIIIVIGFLLEKKFKFNIQILSKLNFYVFIPAYTIVNLYEMDLDSDFLKIILAEFLIMTIANLLAGVYAKKRKYSIEKRNHFQNCVMFNNMGNIGVPIITLMFSSGIFLIEGEPIYLSLAISTQLVIMTTQNIVLNSWGFHKGFQERKDTIKESFKRILSIPMIYAVFFVWILRLLPFNIMGNPGYVALDYIDGGMIPIALLALGMQVGKTGIKLKKVKVFETIIFKMIFSFVIVLGMNMIFKFTGVVAQVFMIATMGPTAVNVALISIEAKSQEEYTSQVVVLSTVIALLVFPFVLYATQFLYPI